MPSKHKGALGAILVAAGVAAFAGNAQADFVPSLPSAVVDNDAVSGVGNADATLTDANVAFQWGNGNTNARVTGTIHVVDEKNASFRLRVESYDRQGHLLSTAYDAADGTPVRTSDAKDIAVDMATPYAPYVNKVLVAVEKQGIGDQWRTQGATATKYLNLHDDSALVPGDGIDIGAGPYFSSGVPGKGGPMLGATISWNIDDEGAETPTFDGSLYFDDFSRCGRVVLRSVSPSGLTLSQVVGEKYCPVDNGLYRDGQTLVGDPVTGASTVEVAMQSKTGGIWQDVNSQTVSIAESA